MKACEACHNAKVACSGGERQAEGTAEAESGPSTPQKPRKKKQRTGPEETEEEEAEETGEEPKKDKGKGRAREATEEAEGADSGRPTDRELLERLVAEVVATRKLSRSILGRLTRVEKWVADHEAQKKAVQEYFAKAEVEDEEEEEDEEYQDSEEEE